MPDPIQNKKQGDQSTNKVNSYLESIGAYDVEIDASGSAQGQPEAPAVTDSGEMGFTDFASQWLEMLKKGTGSSLEGLGGAMSYTGIDAGDDVAEYGRGLQESAEFVSAIEDFQWEDLATAEGWSNMPKVAFEGLMTSLPEQVALMGVGGPAGSVLGRVSVNVGRRLLGSGAGTKIAAKVADQLAKHSGGKIKRSADEVYSLVQNVVESQPLTFSMGMLEGGRAFEQARKQGATKEQAEDVALRVLGDNMIIGQVTNIPEYTGIIKGGSKFKQIGPKQYGKNLGVQGFAEAGEEVAQEGAAKSRLEGDRSFLPDSYTDPEYLASDTAAQAFIGGLTGGAGQKVAVDAGRAAVNKVRGKNGTETDQATDDSGSDPTGTPPESGQPPNNQPPATGQAANQPFKPGDTAYDERGAPVTIESVPATGELLTIVDKDGDSRQVSVDQLQTQQDVASTEQDLAQRETKPSDSEAGVRIIPDGTGEEVTAFQNEDGSYTVDYAREIDEKEAKSKAKALNAKYPKMSFSVINANENADDPFAEAEWEIVGREKNQKKETRQSNVRQEEESKKPNDSISLSEQDLEDGVPISIDGREVEGYDIERNVNGGIGGLEVVFKGDNDSDVITDEERKSLQKSYLIDKDGRLYEVGSEKPASITKQRKQQTKQENQDDAATIEPGPNTGETEQGIQQTVDQATDEVQPAKREGSDVRGGQSNSEGEGSLQPGEVRPSPTDINQSDERETTTGAQQSENTQSGNDQSVVPANTEAESTIDNDDTATQPTEEVEGSVVRKPIGEINIDENRFQNRSELDETVLNNIAENFDENQFDPVVIWNDPNDGETYLLAGHHRLEGANRAGRGDVQAKYFQGTEQEAIEYATRLSNANRTLEKPEERANLYRQDLQEGDKSFAQIEREAKRNEGRNAQMVLDIAHLNPRGKTQSAISAVSGTEENENRRKLYDHAQWIGRARRDHSNLTDRHENQLFDYLQENGDQFRSMSEFREFVNGKVSSFDFEGDNPLPLKKQTRGDAEREYNARMREYKKELSDLRKQREERKKELDERQRKQIINGVPQGEVEITNDVIQERLQPIDNDIQRTQSDIAQLEADRGKYKQADQAQAGLFSAPAEAEQALKDEGATDEEINNINNNQLTDEERQELESGLQSEEDTEQPTSTTQQESESESSVAPPDNTDQLQNREQELKQELDNLFDEFDDITGGQVNMGLDPRALAVSGKIIAKGAELGFVKFQQFVNFVIDQKGEAFLDNIFKAFRASYVANLTMENPNNEDLNEIANTDLQTAINIYTNQKQTESVPDNDPVPETEAENNTADNIEDLENQVDEAQKTVTRLQNELSSLRQRFDENVVQKDQPDMFGNVPQQDLIDDRANQKKVIDDKVAEIEQAKENLRNAQTDLENAQNQQNQNELFNDEDSDVPVSPNTTQRDSGQPDAQDPVGTDGLSTGTAVDTDTGTGSGITEGREQGDSSVPGSTSPAGRESGDTNTSQRERTTDVRNDTGRTEREGGPRTGDQRTVSDQRQAESTQTTTDQGRGSSVLGNLDEKRERQRRVEDTPVKLMDEANVRETLPFLLPQQQDDVIKAEERFHSEEHRDIAHGKGMLYTNGTGTGKTYTGLGIIKRFVKQGKTDILIVVPSQKKVADWIEDGENMLLDISMLDDTSTPGEGVTVTTYANFRSNEALQMREMDLVVYDESHHILSNQSGENTAALKAHRFTTNSPSGARDRAIIEIVGPEPNLQEFKDRAAERDDVRSIPDMKEQGFEAERIARKEWEPLYKQWREDVRENEESIRERQEELVYKTKAVFLSATPFSYLSSLKYADGYLFEINEKLIESDSDIGYGYNQPGAYERFFQENFGYRMRYNKLTRPEEGVDVNLLERNFHEKQRDIGVLSRRVLDVDKDYSRDFVVVEDAAGEKIDLVFQKLQEDDFRELSNLMREAKTFDYIQQMAILEALKARGVKERIDEHLAMGRKVVMFHNFVNVIPENPFQPIIDASRRPNDGEGGLVDQAKRFIREVPEVRQINLADLRNPVEYLTEAYGDRLGVFNGSTVSDKKKQQNVKDFNTPDSGVDLILIQKESGKEGISLHDSDNNSQRVLINLGLPVRPTDMVQTEGRIYRLGVQSNAIFEYPVINLSMERARLSKGASRGQTAENLALGEVARGLKDSFMQGYELAEYVDVTEDQGTGGKQRDQSIESISPFDRAKTYYYAQQKNSSRRDQRAGDDYFATPEPLGMKMVEWLRAQPNEDLLEPSGGHGAIARFFPERTKNTAIEPSIELSTRMGLHFDGAIKNERFEDHHVINKYNGIVMNPPYGNGGKTAMDHVTKATRHLRDGGRIIAIVPDGPSMQKRIDKWLDSKDSEGLQLTGEIQLPGTTFKRAGTQVRTKILVIDKYGNPDQVEQFPQQFQRQIEAESVEEFFDKIEGMDISDRVVLREKGVTESEFQDSDTLDGKILSYSEVFDIVKRRHDKTGEDIYVIQNKERVERDVFNQLRSIAKSHDGYYSGYNRGGAVPGFIFKDLDSVNEFLSQVTDDQVIEEPTVEYASDRLRDEQPRAADRLNNSYPNSYISVRDSETEAAYETKEKYQEALSEVREQLSLFPEKDENLRRQQTDRNRQETDTGRSTNALPEQIREIPYRSVAEDFTEQGYVDFVGKEIRSSYDIANLFKIHRSPLIEKFHIVGMDSNGKIIKTSAVTSNSLGYVSVDKTFLRDAMSQMFHLGVTDIAIVHNHPSSRVQPSYGDIEMTKRFKNLSDAVGLNFRGHVILDTTQYGFLPPDIQTRADARTAKYKAPEIGKKGGKYDSPNKLIDHSFDLVDQTKSPLVAVFFDHAMQATAFEVISGREIDGTNTEDIANRLIELAKSQGSNRVALITEPAKNEKLGRSVEYLKQGDKSGMLYGIIQTVKRSPLEIIDILDVNTDTGDVLSLTMADQLPSSYSTDTTEGKDMRLWEPVTAFTEDNTIDRQKPVFYSTIDNALDQIEQDKATADQWKAMLSKNGAKQAEMDWVDLDGFLEQNSKPTKQEIREHIEANRIEVEDIHLSKIDAQTSMSKIEDFKTRFQEAGLGVNTEFDDYNGITFEITQGFESYRINNEIDENRFKKAFSEDLHELWDETTELVMEIDADMDPDISGAQYSEWTLPGGKNYQELLLTLPGESRFRSSHYNQENILAHVRHNERTGKNGERILFIEEMQSDWAQEGRKKGYINKKNYTSLPDNLTLEQIASDYWKVKNSIGRTIGQGTKEKAVSEALQEINDPKRDIDGMMSVDELKKVQPNPFPTTNEWLPLAIRRMIRYAAEHGFDAVAWTTGEQQAERYNLSKVVDRIEVQSSRGSSVGIVLWSNEDAKMAFDTNLDTGKITDANKRDLIGKKLSDVLGKDIAERIIKAGNRGKAINITNKELEVGGEGMKAFYNKIVPNTAGKILKKLDKRTKVGVMDINIDGQPSKQLGFPVTDKIVRKAVQGLPMFKKDNSSTQEPEITDQQAFEYVKHVKEVTRGWTNSPTLHFYRDIEEAYAANPWLRKGDSGNIPAFYHNNEVHIILNRASSRESLTESLLHEAFGHYGLRGAVAAINGTDSNFETQFNGVMDQVFGAYSETDLMKRIARNYFNKSVPDLLPNEQRIAAEEFIAHTIQSDIDVSLVDKLIALLRRALRQIPAFKTLSLSDAELKTLMGNAKAFVVDKEGYLRPSTYQTLYRTTEPTYPKEEFDFITEMNRLRYGVHKSQIGADVRFKKSIANRIKRSDAGKVSDNAHIEYGRFDNAVRHFQDQMIDVKRLQETKEKQAGKRISQQANIHGKETLTYGKIDKQQQDFMRTHGRPFKLLLRNLQQNHGLTYDQVRNYLYARFAPIRNKEIYERETGKIDRLINETQQELHELETLYDESGNKSLAPKIGGKRRRINNLMDKRNQVTRSGSGMTDAESKQIMNQFTQEQHTELEKLGNQSERITRFVLRTWRDGGIISEKRYEKLKENKNYVPLRGFEESIAEDKTMFSEDLHAFGRSSKAGDVIAYMFAMADSAIVRAEKNKLRESVLDFVKEHPDPNLYTLENTYFVKTGELNSEGKPIYQATTEKPSAMKFQKGIAVREVDWKEVAVEWQNTDNKPVIRVYQNGRPVSIRFNGSGKGQEVARALMNADVERVPKLLEYAGKYTRLLRNLYTQYSPEFAVRNFLRDGTEGFIHLTQDFDARTAIKVINPSTMQGAMRGIYTSLRNESYEGEWGTWFERYLDNGAKSGYFELDQMKERTKKLQNMMVDQSKGILPTSRRAIMETFKYVEDVNTMVENAVRVSTFRHLVEEKGYSEQDAAIYAKNLTVNFNRKGNASGWLGSLYLFFNAAVQGPARLIKPFRSSDKSIRRKAQITPVLLAGGAYVASNALRFLMGTGEDGEDIYDKQSDYMISHYIMIPNFMSEDENDFFKIPLPYGYNTYWAAGNMMNKVAHGTKPAMDAILGLVNTAVGSFSPLGGFESDDPTASIAKILSPEILDPFFELTFNEDFAGRKIYKEDNPFTTPDPDAFSNFDSTNETFVDIARWMNAVTGGDRVIPGMVDVHPETIEYIYKNLTGGTGQFINKVLTTGQYIGQGENLLDGENIRKVPFLSSFMHDTSNFDMIYSYYERYDQLKEINDNYNKYMKSNPDKGLEYFNKNKEELRDYPKAKAIRSLFRDIRDLQELKEKVKNPDSLQQHIKKLSDLRNKQLAEFLKRQHKLRKNRLLGR